MIAKDKTRAPIVEHRWKKRRQIVLDVVVRDRTGLSLRGTGRDISNHGMFIRVPPQAVSANKVVEIEFPNCACVRGWVMHTTDEGIGIMFHSVGNTEQDFLRQLLAEKPVTK